MGPLQRTPGTASTAFSQDPPWLRRRERISLVKNRMREICTSGSVRVAPCKRMEFSRLRWRPRQSLPAAVYRVLRGVRQRPLRSVDREGEAGTKVNGDIAPKSIVVESADLISQWGRQYSRARRGERPGSFRGSYRRHATKGFHGNKGDPSGSGESL